MNNSPGLGVLPLPLIASAAAPAANAASAVNVASSNNMTWSNAVKSVADAATKGYTAMKQAELDALQKQIDFQKYKAAVLEQQRLGTQSSAIDSPYFWPLLIGGGAVATGLLIFMLKRKK